MAAKEKTKSTPKKASQWPRRVNYVENKGSAHTAIVTNVDDEAQGVLTLSVFPKGGKNSEVKAIPHDEEKKPGTWHKIPTE